MSSALLVGLLATLSTALAVVTSTACLVLWRRVTALTSAAKARAELARRVDELTGQYRSIELRLTKVEASSTEFAPSLHPVGPQRRVDRGVPQATTYSGLTLISVPDLATPSASTSEAEADLDRRFGDVWAMVDSGLPVEAIARQTGYPIGQVELILGLRRQVLGAEARADG